MCQSYKKYICQGLKWSTIIIYFIIIGLLINNRIVMVNAIRKGNLLVPSSYSSINGDLYIQLHLTPPDLLTNNNNQNNQNNQNNKLHLQVTYINNETTKTIISILDILPDPYLNVTQIVVPCQHFLYGGIYELEILENNIYSSSLDNPLTVTTTQQYDERLKKQLDVRWPIPKLSVTPESIGTYPEESVNIILEYPGIECDITKMPLISLSTTISSSTSTSSSSSSAATKTTTISNTTLLIPEFWLELYYCGNDVSCNNKNYTKSPILYSEQIRGFPKIRFIKLHCELFGLAGHYIVTLKPTIANTEVQPAAYLKADWNEQFVFNVHARSITPCDPHTGIGVLFQYPACILEKDRVRLYAKQRADVASLAPPTSLHYITEQRVIRGQHSLYFECDLFSEKYIEYCFVYVSEAINGAVANVRMDCLPTLPVSDSDVGGWGPWSNWTPCSTTCAGGTKNRYRVCDSPQPRYGAKFCEGPAVETIPCGVSSTFDSSTFMGGSWECYFGTGKYFIGELPVDRPEIRAEIGPKCHCGCIMQLNSTKPRQIIAASSESCPGRSFWLIQVADDYRIRYHIDFFRIICTTQYLKIRDGDSLNSELLGDYSIGGDSFIKTIISTGSQLLIEFNSNELSTIGDSCKSGFLSHAQQIAIHQANLTIPITSKAVMSSNNFSVPYKSTKLTLLHIIAILFSSIIIVISSLLGVQYIFRYRKYQLAENISEPDSPAYTPRPSIDSMAANQLQSRTISTSTLFSEVISLVKLRPHTSTLKHLRLRESVDGEALENGENISCTQKSQSDDDEISIESSHTLTNETLNEIDNLHKMKNSNNNLSENLSYSSPPSTTNSINLPPIPVRKNTPMPTRKYPTKRIVNNNNTKRKTINDGSKHCGDGDGVGGGFDIYDNNNNNNNNNNSYNNNYETKSVNGKPTRKKKLKNEQSDINKSNSQTTVTVEEDIETDSETLFIKKNRRIKKLSVSNGTLTNGCYSPASSLTSTATIRTTNVKESKEKQNRELLAGPGSEFSLANGEDFELDYYDYNVINAGAAPGSYLGMDPAYLVWIPPLDDANIINEIENENDYVSDDDDDDDDNVDDEEPHYEEILPHFNNINPGSNTETPSEEKPIITVPPVVPPPPSSLRHQDDYTNRNNHDINNKILASSTLKYCNTVTIATTSANQLLTSSASISSASSLSSPPPPPPSSSSSSSSGIPNVFRDKLNFMDAIPMQDLSKRNLTTKKFQSSPVKVHQPHSTGLNKKSIASEKETTVIKSPSDNSINNVYYELDDLQFVDDEEDDVELSELYNKKMKQKHNSNNNSNNNNQLKL